MAKLLAKDKSRQGTNWDVRHNHAVALPNDREQIIPLLRAWEGYGNAHKRLHDDVIGNDHFANQYFVDIAKGIRGLLNMDLGRLDGGTLDAFILDTLEENGIDEEI